MARPGELCAQAEPGVSPGKSWVGVSGGLLAAGLAAAAAAAWLKLPALQLVTLGMATALISVLGDLTQSMFKRNVGLKDSGSLLPGSDKRATGCVSAHGQGFACSLLSVVRSHARFRSCCASSASRSA